MVTTDYKYSTVYLLKGILFQISNFVLHFLKLFLTSLVFIFKLFSKSILHISLIILLTANVLNLKQYTLLVILLNSYDIYRQLAPLWQES